ncbi:MAG: S8 family serine peptidase [Deltaproteobacteria bacterium]|nr:S8 family serine peptidase [Deltaproteobacteria bacterium]
MLVAILDSGLHRGHPHLAGARVSGFGIDGDVPPFVLSDDFTDRTGHGTAVTAALHRLAPDVDLLAVRVLDDELRCTTDVLAAAIEEAARRGADIINLSLGSMREEARGPLQRAVTLATERGAVCVAAAHPRGRPLYPADLPGVLSATTHRSCPLADLFVVPGPLPRFLAHGFPRPIEGRAPSDNFFGPSFATVHLTGRVAALLAAGRDPSIPELAKQLREQATGDWTST